MVSASPRRKREPDGGWRVHQGMRIAWAVLALFGTHAIAFAQEERPLINRLDPKTRGKVVLALTGLVILGLLMVAMTWLTFRIIRRRIRHSQEVADRQRLAGRDEDDWAKKPL